MHLACVEHRLVPHDPPRPLTELSPIPGTRKSSPTFGLVTMLRSESIRLLPGRSPIASRRSSSTATNPGGPPFGDTSQVPSAFAVASSRSGVAR